MVMVVGGSYEELDTKPLKEYNATDYLPKTN